jgi:SpoVK/Ycf46/Vps4 family AAA+-type ATPase
MAANNVQPEQQIKKINRIFDLGDFSGAADAAVSALKSHPSNHEFSFLAGMAYYLLGDSVQSYRYFKQATISAPQNSDYNAWAFIAASAENSQSAFQYKTKIMNVESAVCKAACAEYYFSEHDYNKAQMLAEQAYRMDNRLVPAVLVLARALEALKMNIPKALSVLQDNPAVWRVDAAKSLALKIQYKSGDYAGCKKLCKKILTQHPNSLAATAARDMLIKIKNAEDGKGGTERELVRNSDEEKLRDNVKIVKRDSASLDDAVAKLNSLTGLASVKEHVDKLRKKIEYDRIRQERLGIKENERPSYHFVFRGNPGTGKTIVARLLGDIFYYLGILEKGHLVETDRSGLVGQYIGETAQKTQKVIEEAMGGILFIDEAYALSRHDSGSRDFGIEAIDTLIKAVEDKRDKFIVILAGYIKEMGQLLKMNPGLASRFNRYIDFPDYSDSELLEIANSIAAGKHYTISAEGKRAFIEMVNRMRVDENFGNAREVRNIMEKAFEEKAKVSDPMNLSREYLTTLTPMDFGVNVDESPEERAERYLMQLEELTGLDDVKTEISSFVNHVKYQRGEDGVFKTANMHMVFSGNPGTGKTTVARLLGMILKEIGILKKGQFVEATRADLVGEWLGHTAPKTINKCKEAYGGILFIDEAYGLYTGNHDNFGKEAIDALIKEMEDNRDKMVIILAGYTGKMRELLDANPGFKSRINQSIEFDDYTPEQMFEIFTRNVSKAGLFTESGALDKARKIFQALHDNKTENFGNARDVRKLFEAAEKNMINRVINGGLQGNERKTITAEDVRLSL